MPDSWIDKDDLDKLIGVFSSRKGRARPGASRRGAGPRVRPKLDFPSQADPEKAEPETAEADLSEASSGTRSEELGSLAGSDTLNLPETEPDDAGLGEREEVAALKERVAHLEEKLVERAEKAAGPEGGPQDFEPVPEILPESLPDPGGWIFEMDDGLEPAPGEVEVGAAAPSDGEEAAESALPDEPPFDSGVIEFEGAPHEAPAGFSEPSAGELPEGPAERDAGTPPMESVSEFDDEVPLREVPDFLGGGEASVLSREMPLPERDSDRAHNALAEARARAEKGRLFRPRPEAVVPSEQSPASVEEVGDQIAELPIEEAPVELSTPLHELEDPLTELPIEEAFVELPTPSGELDETLVEAAIEEAPVEFSPLAAAEEGAAIPLESSPEFEPRVAESPIEAGSAAPLPLPPSEQEDPGPPPEISAETDFENFSVEERRLNDRLAGFGELARTRLQAREVAVCDRDGFLLCAMGGGSDEGDRETLETSILLEISRRTNPLLGIVADRATQISVGGGAWHCLLRGEGEADRLFVGFLLPRPLELPEIEYWVRGLGEVIRPSATSR